MKNLILRIFSTSYLGRAFLSTPSPRWMVLAADMMIVLFSCVLTFLFNPLRNVPARLLAEEYGLYSLAILGVYCVFALLLHTNRYIIRLTAIEDMYRLVLLVVTSSMALVVWSLTGIPLNGSPYLSIWNIFTIGVVSFSLMLVMRLSIKYLYIMLTTQSISRKRVIILGSAINSFFLASALKSEFEGRYEPVALLSLSDRHANSSVNGVPIVAYRQDKIAEIFRTYRCDTLMFLSTQIEIIRSQYADIFLNNGIKLLMLNQIEEFDLNSKVMPQLSPHVQDIRIEDLLGRDVIDTHNPRIREMMNNQVAMVTGAAGSIGSEITEQLARFAVRELVLVDQAETPMHDLQLHLQEKFPGLTIHYCIADVTNQKRMRSIFNLYRPRYVFHAAAYKHVPMMECNPMEAVLTNVIGTKTVADLAAEFDADKFVMVSTDKAVNPTNIMGASKRIAEIYVQSLFYHFNRTTDRRHTAYITTRFGNVLGSNGSVIPLFRRQIAQGGPVTVTHKDIIRYFMTIPEACSLVLEAGGMGRGGEIFIFDMGQPVKIYDLAVRMISLAGLKVGEDIQIIETGLRPGEKLYEELLNDRERTMATHHKKIMIAQVRRYEMEDVLTSIENMHRAILDSDTYMLVREMKTLVPEFKSNNSRWEAIDTDLQNLHRHNSPAKPTHGQ